MFEKNLDPFKDFALDSHSFELEKQDIVVDLCGRKGKDIILHSVAFSGVTFCFGMDESFVLLSCAKDE